MWREHEQLIAFAFYAAIVVAMVVETLVPRRKLVRSAARRWLNVSGLWLINTLLSQLTVATSMLAAAALTAERSWGLVPMLALPAPAALVAGFVLLDLASYLTHRASHVVPALWRLHVVHHSDADVDISTALRNHPADYLLGAFMLSAAVVLLGVPFEAVLVYQIASAVGNALRHANIRVHPRLEAALRPVLVTADLHRIHHSALERETNSNFGSLFSCWDRLFDTYRTEPEHGDDAMILGLEYFRDSGEDRLLSMLTQPLRQPDAQNALRSARLESPSL